MFKIKNLVIYKNKAAIISEIGDKITIKLNNATDTVRVREKDIEFLHSGPLENFDALSDVYDQTQAEELWELALCEGDIEFSLNELAGFLAGGDCAANAWTVHLMLEDNLYFEGDAQHIKAKSADIVSSQEEKRENKNAEDAERAAFLSRLKDRRLQLPEDLRFLQDVAQLAFGKSEKSRTMRDAGLSPEACADSVAAHKLLLETGVWNNTVNPYPSRYGVSMQSPKISTAPPPANAQRRDLTHLAAYAIDDEGSTDPDDAVSVELNEEGTFLYVHVADPAATITAGSEADIDARARGATFYAPEGAVRMLNDDALPIFALGMSETSPALSFKIKLSQDNSIEKTEIFYSTVKVTRISYREADDKLADAEGSNKELSELYAIAERNVKRRLDSGAVQIEFPEVQIYVKIPQTDAAVTAADKQSESAEIEIKPLENYRSRILVRECMLLAGEAAGEWALEKRIAFPFISQEIEKPEAPDESAAAGADAGGYAGAYQLRRCMRQRVLSTKPGLHQGLGLDIYTQVTSPLRRYTDLLAHQQIHAYLDAEAGLDDDELLARLAAAERAAIATSRAERASRSHWTTVYCAQTQGTETEAMEAEGIVIAIRGSHAVVLIPTLGLETQAALPRGSAPALNSTVRLKLTAARLPECETVWNMV
jgi:exoribonuclease-2